MLEVYWGCFVGGALFVVVTIIFGDVLGSLLDGVLDFLSPDGSSIFNPLTIVGGITIFGGSGILLTKYSAMTPTQVLVISISIALFCSLLLYYFYIRPMSRAENSTGYSIQELRGTVGEVSVSIPADGYGEVIIRFGAGVVHQTASSFEQQQLSEGSKVVVVEVADGVLQVALFNTSAKDL